MVVDLSKDYINIPKDATQQSEFLENYPLYDGRGLLIAILDTGVDLSFDGMQKTTTGLPKVIDCYDFTGAGCVDTSVVKEVNANNELIGLSGRTLMIPSTWKNPSGQWHLGIKSIYEICSGDALKSIIVKRKESISQQNKALKEGVCETMKNDKENYASIFEYIKMTEDLSKDSLVADCIVWFNGEKWQACIDTSFIGNLENVNILSNFNEKYEYGKLWNILSYCVKIHNNGNLLDIITAFDDHGTFVAHVAAAYFPDEPKRNGLAPGAQIISMTVMDSRNDNYLNFQALRNALEKCVELKVDIINCSFICPSEYLKKQINKMTKKYGIIIVFGAGNDGPVYSSVNGYTFFLQDIFMIGSVLMEKKNNQITYKIPSYSSRGPNHFGDRGICFTAPGNATFALPEYYHEKVSHIKGTSLASPNFAGSIACLISALKNHSIKYSPSIIRFALSETAFLPPNGNALEYGHGIIQINEAFKFLKSADFLKKYGYAKVQVKLLKEEKNGIFLKVHERNNKIDTKSYSIDILHKPKSDKFSLQMTPGAEKFIKCSDLQNHKFIVKIDPAKLKSGTINYAEIYGINLKNSLLGNIFCLPITVLIPQQITEKDNYSIQKMITVMPETPVRLFILPPEKSCQCLVKITSLENFSTKLCLNYALEKVPIGKENEKLLQFPGIYRTQTQYIKISCDKILEIALIFPPSQIQSAKFKVEIIFFGISLKQEKNKNEMNRLIFTNSLKTFAATLSMGFKKVSYNLVPDVISTETVPNIYDQKSTEFLKLSYTFEVLKETKCCFKMNYMKKYPLYQAQVFTESKKYVCGFQLIFDVSVTLLAGKYTIIAYVFYTKNPSSSSKNTTTAIPAAKNLPSINITLDLYKTFTPKLYSNSTMDKDSKYTSKKLTEFEIGEHQIYFEKIPADILPQPLPQKVTFHGSLNFRINNTVINVPLDYKYNFHNEKEDDKNNNNSAVVENLDNVSHEIRDSLKATNSKNSKKKVIKNDSENIIPLKFKENFESELTNLFSTNKDSCINEINVGSKINENNLAKAQEYVIKVCKIFHEKTENGNILKELAQIKQALLDGHLGTALLHLNKFSINHQTNPTINFIDLAIIELLKHLKCDHLVEAHRHTLLDRHRDYYRLL